MLCVRVCCRHKLGISVLRQPASLLSFYGTASDYTGILHCLPCLPQLHQEVTCGPAKAHHPVTLNALEITHTVSQGELRVRHCCSH